MKPLISLLLIVFLNQTICSQTEQKECPCCTIEHQQFDFWLGDWDVFSLDGKKVGENNITAIQNHCGIQEQWTSSSGITGTSYNYYDAANAVWNQIYIDNLGTILHLKGQFKDGNMVLTSDKVKSTKSDSYYYNQITWSKDGLGNVIQKWDIIDESGTILQVAFEGIYKPKAHQATTDGPILIIEYVKILNDKKEEALYYYQHNWKAFRDVALASKYIKSYQLLDLNHNNSEYDLLLITEYPNWEAYEKGEERFQNIIKTTRPNGPEFLNELRPNDFRQTLSAATLKSIGE